MNLYRASSPERPQCAVNLFSGIGRFEGSGGVRASIIRGCLAPSPAPPPYKENFHRIFTFCMDPTGQLREVRPPGPPASYAAVLLKEE